MEKKSNILDSTADAVDKNFQAITELERNVRSIDADIRDVPDRIIDLNRSLDEVMAFRPKLDAAIVRLDEVDGAMADAEKRATELNKAREWLARAETRFDELNKKSQEHLKMLNDILKDEPSSGRKDKGAPSISVQETVRKLSHQGWKVEEIARAVKLSRGEVELILELGGQD
jgi:predicted RNase H-like nuclease (RuvC/YqgF family)